MGVLLKSVTGQSAFRDSVTFLANLVFV